MLQDWMIPEDLAPGDAKSLLGNWTDLQAQRVESPDDSGFDEAFQALWAEFGPHGEIEQPTVIAKRLRWNGNELLGGWSLCYRLILFRMHGKFAAVRDHTAIVSEWARGAIVHLSHSLVAREWRRSGLAGWLRALPIATARECLAARRLSLRTPITLVGEMKFLDHNVPSTFGRLKAYESAGYLMVDPRRVAYLQPDFRVSEEIDLNGGPRPVPLALIVRRVGREKELTISGTEVRALAEALYRIYTETFRPRDMASLIRSLDDYPAPDEVVDLLPPTTVLRE